MDKNELLARALEEACKVVLDEGETIYIKDIAERMGVRQAALESAIGDRRSFAAKVTVRLGAMIWQRESDSFGKGLESEKYKALNGAQQVRELWLTAFLYTYRGHPDFWRWLYRFERFIVQEKIPATELGDYQRQLEQYYPPFIMAFEKGRADGTIRPGIEPADYYGATTQALMSICLKFCSAPKIATDTTATGERLINTMIDMSYRYILER